MGYAGVVMMMAAVIALLIVIGIVGTLATWWTAIPAAIAVVGAILLGIEIRNYNPSQWLD